MNESEQLLMAAQSARKKAYAPYSHFQVGAAILTPSGKIYVGCNVENASFPCGTCAEAGAIAAMIAGGERQIAAILVAADAEHILPCGNCLQKIAEFAIPETIIYSADLRHIVAGHRLTDLLPQHFSPEQSNGK